MALIIGLIATVAATFVVPTWTLTDVGALSGTLDYALAFVFALVPGAAVAALVFMLGARRCASRDLGLLIRDQG